VTPAAAAAAGDGERAEPGVDRGPRGRLWVYGLAFALLLVSGYLQFRGNLDVRLTLVWTSIGLSGAALVAAVLSVVLPGRRIRRARVDSIEDGPEPEPEPEPSTEPDAETDAEGRTAETSEGPKE